MADIFHVWLRQKFGKVVHSEEILSVLENVSFYPVAKYSHFDGLGIFEPRSYIDGKIEKVRINEEAYQRSFPKPEIKRQTTRNYSC